MNGGRRWILVKGTHILGVIAGFLIYLVYGCMYRSFSFSDFYQKSPPISLLSVHRVISTSDPHKFSRG